MSCDPKLFGEHNAEFTIEINGKDWTVYTVSIADRDILIYADQGTATLLVDSYGDRHVWSVFDWELSND